ncbi:class I SAM-dependent methyltransferase [Burkholderia alba]|uniref:class I SAM-dependent methyltransferase n=1 Tax=Burkholderia alba TaxID=2683677 RepID=UPI002B057BEC|nr:class I SAM-dependent methyltransferase [Burkholderia alba]
MNAAPSINREQADLWNGHAGHAWVDTQASIDQMFKPIETLLVEAIPAGCALRVLDVGCGTGGTTLAAARRLGAQGRCTGVDISGPMLAAARARATRDTAPADFVLADAQTHAFEPASVDLILSRFGVMFFDAPGRAFANLRRAATDAAELRIVAWRSAADNPFMTSAERVAAPLLPDLPAREPGAPGQFAFADPRRIASILEEGGWFDIDIRPIDVDCTLPEPALTGYLSRLGPVGLRLRDVDASARARVIDTMRAAFEPYVDGEVVRFVAACWMVRARASAASRA